MRKIATFLGLFVLAVILTLLILPANGYAENRVVLQCPVNDPVIEGDSIPINVLFGNDVPLGGISLGFTYDSPDVEITSFSMVGSSLSTNWQFPKSFLPAENLVLFGGLDLFGGSPEEADTTLRLAFTMWMRVPVGTPAQCINIDSSFVPPAGTWTFAPTFGLELNPAYSDCGDGDVSIGGASCVPNQPPVVSDIPNQTILEGGAFATISLDNYVIDESPDNQISWAATSASPNGFSVDIVNRVATISHPGGEFSGSATFTFTATDPGALTDSDDATFTVTAVNDPPNVADIPDQAIPEGGSFTTINLDDYVTDPDNADNQMTWQATSASPNGFTVAIVDRVATISHPGGDFNGSATFTFKATDPGAQFDTDDATFTVTPVNDPPVVSDIPDQSLPNGATFATINLDDHVSDVDNSDAQMTWTYSGNSQLTVDISAARVATISKPSPGWFGSETITFKATDPGALFDSDDATFTIAEPGPFLVLSDDTLNFNATLGGSNPAGKIVSITNGGGGSLTWSAVDSETWLSIAPDNGTAPSGFTASCNISGLLVGAHEGTITVSSPEATNSPQIVVVILNIYPRTIFGFSTDSLDFYGVENDTNPSPKSIDVSNASPAGGEFDWKTTETAPWLTIDPTMGTTPSTVQFSVDITGLAPGDYAADVIFEEIIVRLETEAAIDTVKVYLTVDRSTDVDDGSVFLPESYSLEQNYPNPFNPETVIEYALPADGFVSLKVYNILGQEVKGLAVGMQNRGRHRVTWDGTDAQGLTVQSGVYFYRIEAGDFAMTRKMLLVK